MIQSETWNLIHWIIRKWWRIQKSFYVDVLIKTIFRIQKENPISRIDE